MNDVVDTATGEVIAAVDWDDSQWEGYIREADPAVAIFERAKRIHEYQAHCRAKHGKQGGSYFTQFMAERFGMSQSTSSQWACIGASSPKLIDNVNKFAPDWLAVYQFTTLPKPDQKALLSLSTPIDRKAVSDAKAAHKISQRKAEIEAQRDELSKARPKAPLGLFNVIAVDPPWPYDNDASEKSYHPNTRRASNPYPEMSLEAIAALKLPAANDCVLWLWTTHKFMRHAFPLLDSWGFAERAILTWVKDRMGLGRWLRSQSEFCIMATKGKPLITLENQTTVLNGPLREHSRKPDEFYAMVDGLCVGRKLDYFSREPRDGWEQFGNDKQRFAMG